MQNIIPNGISICVIICNKFKTENNRVYFFLFKSAVLEAIGDSYHIKCFHAGVE